MSDVLRERVTAALDDAYDVGREVGRGGMGVVYRATDRKLRRDVAIKVLPPELAYREDVKQRFLREAQTAAQLSHANIVPIYAVEERVGLVCFVMALVDGESLANKISRERQLSFEFTAETLIAVADALGYAHGRGIVHRDVKPDNILLDRHSGRPMVTDFGIARAAEGDSRLTVTGIAVGTPAYMSPEQATGEKEIDGRSDLYSLAVVGYHMLCGELPFHASNTPSMLMKHISEAPRPIREVRPEVPEWLAAVIECAMAKKPADRFASAHAFRDALATRKSPAAARQPAPEVHASAAWKHAVPPQALEGRVRLPRVSRAAAALPQAPARTAIEAANPGWSRDERQEARPPVPAWMPASWRDTRKEWQGAVTSGGRDKKGVARDQLPVIEKIRRFRRQATSTATTLAFLTVINVVFSPGFFWVVFPAFGMLMGLLRHWGSLRDDGVKWEDVYGAGAQAALARHAEQRGRLSAGTPRDHALSLAPPEVLAGPHGDVVRRAARDREQVRDAVDKLGKADREMIPDVLPTVDALAERIGSLAGALHRIDADTQPEAMAEVARRLEVARGLPEGREREQRIQLLERQLSTMQDLAARRETLASQVESASLMLQSMRLDLVALRSAGVQAAMNDVSSATQEARVLSREIANVLDAAKEVR